MCSIAIVPAFADLPDAARPLKAALERNINAARDQMLAEKIAAMAQYSNALSQAAEACQKAGDLDGLLAFTEERKRLATGRAIPDADEPGVNRAITRIRATFRAAFENAKKTFAAQESALLRRHVEDLESLKKSLTIEGKTADAIAVRDHITLISGELRKIAPSSEPPPAAEQKAACPFCDGTGKRASLCPKCSGTGLCASCDGAGSRKSSLKGSSDRLPCLTCKRTGKCTQCAGKGSVSGSPCDECQGAGKISKAKADALESRRNKPLPSNDRLWVYRLRELEVNAGLEMAARIKDDVEREKIIAADLDKVLLSPEAFRGKACRSRVTFRWGENYQLTVSARPDVDYAVQLTPYSRFDMDALSAVYATTKRGDPIVITYGFLEPNCLVLFRVAPFPR